MLIHTRELKLYDRCPKCYELKRYPKIDPFLVAVKKALIYLYSFEMSNNHKVTPSSMINKWDKIWSTEAAKHNLTSEEISEKAVNGWLIINKYINDIYLEDYRIPRLVNLTHREQVDKFHFETDFDVILLDPQEDEIFIIEFTTLSDHYVMKDLENNIEIKTKLFLLSKALNHNTCQLIKCHLNQSLTKVIISMSDICEPNIQSILVGLANNIKRGLFDPSPLCKESH